MANIVYMTALGVNDQSIFGACQCLDLVPRSSNSMSTLHLPTKIWIYIFSFACMDTGVLSDGFSNIQRVIQVFLVHLRPLLSIKGRPPI